MTQKRQKISENTILVRSLALSLLSQHHIDVHAHEWPQLIYATDGVMTVDTPTGSWVVPPQRAAWIPADFAHTIRTTGLVNMRTLYFRPDVTTHLPTSCAAISVTPLLKELVLEIIRRGMLLDIHAQDDRLVRVILDQLSNTHEEPLRIVFPSDSRAKRVAETAKHDLAANRPLIDLAQGTGASVRTIERLFLRETGLTFGKWLRRLRVLHALERLASGDSVAAAGLSVGYASTSAFIAMFKSAFGITPGSYIATLS